MEIFYIKSPFFTAFTAVFTTKHITIGLCCWSENKEI